MSSTYNTLQVALRGGVQTITLNRPDVLNCMSTEAYREMAAAFDEASNDPAVDCVVLRGSGRAFCTGGDLKEIAIAAAAGKLQEKIDEFADSSMAAFEALEKCQKIVITVVTGICQASGVSMVLSSDLVLAAADATFKVPEVLVGLADPFIAARLFGRVGIARAKWLTFTAEKISAQEALDAGLVNRIMPAEELEAAVGELTATLAATSPKSRAEYKRGINEALPALDPNIMLRANRSPDAVEGTTAFMEKRAPAWPQLPPKDFALASPNGKTT